MALPSRFLLGVNYWSRAGGPRMWERFDEARVQAELVQMRAVGLDCCRMFAFVPSFMPEPPRLDEAKLALLGRFAALAESAGIGLFPTALVGHMSGENWDFPGQRGRSLYADPELRAWQRALVESMVRALAPSPAVLGWVLSNEMPLWGRPPFSADEIAAWCDELVGAVRAADPRARPVSTGDGAMGGWPTRRLAPLLDWLGPHVYGGDVDPLRQAFLPDLAMRALHALGRPILLEEFGGSSTQAGEPEQAAYVRDAIVSALAVGARGAMVWCWSDFDVETIGREPPYSHHGFELGFGLVRADGSEKPVCDELRALRRLVDGIDVATVRPRAPTCAIVRPRYLDEDFPFSWEDREWMKRVLLQSFVLASQAGLDAVIVGEEDDLDPYTLLLCPATQKLTVPTWLKLRDRARAGATVYWSYSSGDYNFHQGMWCPNFTELTGLKHRLRYGCFDLPPERFVLKPFGAPHLSVPTGIAQAQAPWPLSRLPIEVAEGAQVRTLAVDDEGRPALTVHPLGQGRVIFLAWPLERYLAQLTDGSSREAHRLYRAVANEAGLEADYPTRHPDVIARVLEDGRDDLVIVQHRGWRASVDDATDVPREAEIVWERAAPPGALGPKGVRIYRVRNAR